MILYYPVFSKHTFRASLTVLATLLIIGCGRTLPMAHDTPAEPLEPKNEPLSPYGNPLSYEVDGKTYYVLQSAHNYSERGVASWYGDPFHGQRASSGETYNMYAMSAAHKTLPLPTYACVTNLENGKRIIVRINDRGPFVKNRLIDLSFAAAQKLDIIKNGTALVEVTAINPGQSDNMPASQRSPSCSIRIFIQTGAFGQKANAEKLAAQLRSAGFDHARMLTIEDNSSAIHKVRIGPLSDITAMDMTIEQLEKAGFSNSRVVIERQRCSH